MTVIRSGVFPTEGRKNGVEGSHEVLPCFVIPEILRLRKASLRETLLRSGSHNSNGVRLYIEIFGGKYARKIPRIPGTSNRVSSKIATALFFISIAISVPLTITL